MSVFNDKCNDLIMKVQELLKHEPEWVARYSGYASLIRKNLEIIKENKVRFREWAPLHLYMTIGQAKSQMQYGLRYLGQDVAKLKVGKDGINISTAAFTETNKKNFDCDIILDDCGWRSEKAKSFRQHFSGPLKRSTLSGKSNHEHRLESLLITEFSKKIREEKLICNIQPVKLAGFARFQMPTPLGASNMTSLKYSGANGGGIDIISRIGKDTKLCIMEVKDENKSQEPPAKAIQQGLAYATFIRELLRSECGEEWWKIFGFTRKLPESIDLYVACVMPSLQSNDVSFAGEKINVGNDSFHLHYLYYEEQDNKLSSISSSLPQCEVTQQGNSIIKSSVNVTM